MSRNALGTVGFVSLGCAKNLIDSETMLGRLAEEGFTLTADHDHCDVVVINTCGFLESAREEALETIRHSIERKADGDVHRVVVAGCMVGNYRDELLDAVPQVDGLISVNDREQLTSLLRELKSSGEMALHARITDPDAHGSVYNDRGRLRLTPQHYAYLRISEGCDHTCSFCVIPKIRGRHRSKTIEDVLAEAQELVADGARELVLVAQDSTYYGSDIYNERKLAALLKVLNDESGADWIRVMYAYPNQVTDELVETMAGSERVLPYLDMPLQHINGNVLKRMRRGGNRKMIEGWITRFRESIPHFTLRSTFIAGFPGETEDEHQELVDWLAEGWVDRAGCFAFSPESDAHSATLDGHLPDQVRAERHAAVMEKASAQLFGANESKVGTTQLVLIDGESSDPKYPYVGRSVADAPEVDCSVLVKVSNDQELSPGQFVNAKVTASLGYDLLAETEV